MRLNRALLALAAAILTGGLLLASTSAGSAMPAKAQLAKLPTLKGVDFGANPTRQFARAQNSFIQEQLGLAANPQLIAPGGDATSSAPKNFACVNGRQTDDPLSPPCNVDAGPTNAGATYQGVTSDEIRVVITQYGNWSFPCGAVDEACTTQNRATPHDVWFDLDKPQSRDVMFARGLQDYAKYFNARFQTFGRRVHFFMYFFDSATYYSVEGSKHQAKAMIDALHPFAAILGSPQFSDAMASEFARRGVPTFTDLWSPAQADDYYQQYPNKLWGYWPTIEESADSFAGYVCRKVINNPVSMSGNAGENGKPRKIGLVYGLYHDTQINKQTADEVRKRVEACGGEIADVGEFVNGNGCHTQDYRHTPVADIDVISRFMAEGITTVLWPTCISSTLGQTAVELGYRPEWVVLGDYEFDANGPVAAAGLNPLFDKHAVVVTPATVEPPLHQKRCYEAMHSVDATISDFDAFWVCRNYGNFRQLFSAIQVAGPKLGPASIGAGLHSLPTVASTDALTPTCSYASGDATCVKDAMAMYWDASAKTPYNDAFTYSGRTGCWRVIDGGRRYLPSGWPTSNIDVDMRPTDPCNDHNNDYDNGVILPDRYHVTAGIPGAPETLPVVPKDFAADTTQAVAVGAPSSVSYPPLRTYQGPTLAGSEQYAPTDCRSKASTSCDLINIDLPPPPHSTTTDTLLDITVRWDGSRGNKVRMTLFDLRAAPDGTRYYGITTDDQSGSSPEHIQIINPDQTRYLLRVTNLAPRNRGYSVDVALTNVALDVPVDYSAAGAPAPPPPAVGRPAARADVPAEPDAVFPIGGALAVRARPAASGSRGSGVAGGPWRVLIALAFAFAIGIGAFVRRRDGEPSGRAGLGAFIRARTRDTRLFWKLLLPFLVLILIGGMAAAFVTTRYLTSRASNQLDQSLSQRSLAATSYVRDREAELVDAQRFAANIEGLPAAVAAGDGADAARAMESALAVNKQLDLLAAVGPTGQGVAEFMRSGGTFTQSAGSSFDSSAAVDRALHGASAGTAVTPEIIDVEDGVLFTVAGPVRNESVVGAMVAGLRLDLVASAAARRVDGAVAFFDASGRRVAASSPSAFATRLPVNVRPGSAPFRQREHRNGRDQATIYTPIDEAGTLVGTLAVDLPSAPAYAAVSGARAQLVLIVMLLMAAVVGLGALVSRSVLRRLNRLVETNRALGAGDLTVRVPELGRDEVGELGAGFNVMAEQLEASYADMERRVADRTEELQRLYQDLVRGNEARSDLFAAISHEFRTPIFAILAHAELMGDPQLRPAGTRWLAEFADTISESGQILLRRVNDILELAQLENTELELHVSPFALSDLVERVRPQAGALARQAGLDLSMTLPDDLPLLRGDMQRVEQILLNLLSNAIKYNRDGGSVALTASRHHGGIEIRIIDTGVGIPKKGGDRIFEPFYRVGNSPTRHSSSGLGLALAKRLVEAQGGTISFKSKPGVGTTFFVVFPAVV